jgi:hypothetical protein
MHRGDNDAKDVASWNDLRRVPLYKFLKGFSLEVWVHEDSCNLSKMDRSLRATCAAERCGCVRTIEAAFMSCDCTQWESPARPASRIRTISETLIFGQYCGQMEERLPNILRFGKLFHSPGIRCRHILPRQNSPICFPERPHIALELTIAHYDPATMETSFARAI